MGRKNVSEALREVSKRLSIRLFPVFALVLLLSLSACASRYGQTEQDAEATPVRVSGSGTALPLVEKLADAYSQENPDSSIQIERGTNSGGAIQGVLDGTLELAVANRPLDEEEASQPLEYNPFARDAIVFAVGSPYPVEGLSTAEIRDIYDGTVTSWDQVSGPDEPILVLDRDEDESARKLVLVPFMDGRPVEARTTVLTSASDMLQALKDTPYSLGYTSLGLLRIEEAQQIQVLDLDGVTPGPESLTTGDYPWYLTFGLINYHDAPPEVRQFVEFATGPEGHQILEQYEYVEPED